MENTNLLRIAIQSKGRLYEDTTSLLKEAGIKVNRSERALLVRSNNFPIEVLYLRDDDIPQTVASGTADIGIVGLNEVMERNEDVSVIQHLGLSKCHLSIAIPKAMEYTGPQWLNNKQIATSYPHILNDFLQKNNVTAKVHVITGSVEITPLIGLGDAIFDIVSSGSTLITNNLKEVEKIMESDAVVIANKSLTEEKRKITDEILFRFQAAIDAQKKKYIMMNAPKTNLQQILEILPESAKSPTIIPLADDNWCSVHTVIEEKHFWECIGELKKAGAQGILVVPIEKIVL
jgi:ATP phosphoribosyltransferase